MYADAYVRGMNEKPVEPRMVQWWSFGNATIHDTMNRNSKGIPGWGHLKLSIFFMKNFIQARIFDLIISRQIKQLILQIK